MKKEIIVSDTNNFELMQRQAIALFKSRFFKDIATEAQAIAKIMAGSELGIPPVASLSGIHIVEGKPVLGATVIASLIDNNSIYSYKVLKNSNVECSIEFFKNKESIGISSFTIEEAVNAGIANKPNWTKYPSDMLFARAISRGARRFTPGIFCGSAVYTPGEIEIDEKEEVFIEENVDVLCIN